MAEVVGHEITQWAVLSAWRGDRALFTRALRAAEERLTNRGQARISIDVYVPAPQGAKDLTTKGIDRESVRSVEEFTTHVTEKAVRRFVLIRFEGEADGLRIELSLARNAAAIDGSRRHDDGALVLVTAASDAEETAREGCDAVATALSRASWWCTREPRIGRAPSSDAGTEARSALSEQVQRRRKRVRRIAIAAAIGVALLGLGLGLVAHAIAAKLDFAVGGPWALAGFSAAACGGLALAAALVPASRRFLFPAVQIADLTPGRQWERRLTRNLGVGTVLTTLATTLIKRWATK